MRVHPLGSLAVGILLFPIVVASQAPPGAQGATLPGPPAPRAQTPPRDGASAQEPTGTGRIRGRVLAADSSTPLRRAYVRIAAAELRVNRGATTDAEGRYEIGDLPRGRYSIFVSRNGYVSLQFGQQRPFEPGRPLDLGDGQLMDRIDFALPRGSVIAGRVTDEVGEPISGVRMQAMRHQYLPSGQRRLMPTGPTGPFNLVTNDLGEFRIFGLMPGTYVVSAIFEDPSRMFAPPTSDAAASRGNVENDGFGITYYPGTISAEEAQPVTVGIAEEATASFALVPARMTRISGVVRDSLGRPVVGAALSVRTATGSGGMFSRGVPGGGTDGAFTITNVPPGEHFLEVYPRSADDEWASVAITASGRDITDLLITTSPGATISGQVIFEGTSPAPKPGRIIVTAPDPGGPPPSRGMQDSGTIDAAGRFQLKGVSGRALFRAVQLAPIPMSGWSIKSVMLNGVDFTDTPLDIVKSGDVSGVEIVITDKQTTVSGMVRNARGEQIKDYAVAIFPDRMKEGALPMRFTRVVRPDQEGRFQTRGLPDGDYFAVAVPALEQGGEWDPAFRKQVEPTAKRFRLTEGQTLSLDLPLQQ